MLRFIVVDGLDGCGKDTHAENIRRLLKAQGDEVIIVSHPSRRLFGRLSKSSLEESGPGHRLLATLFYTADVLVSARWLKSQQSGTVIFVRYLLGAAYLPEKLAGTGYIVFRKLLRFPDIAFFIDIEPQVALRRIVARGHRPEMFETEEKLAKVREIAKRLAAREWTIIDNSQDGDGPFQEVGRILRAKSFIA